MGLTISSDNLPFTWKLHQVRLQSQTAVLSGREKYSVDQFALTDIRSVLKDQQEGIQVSNAMKNTMPRKS